MKNKLFAALTLTFLSTFNRQLTTLHAQTTAFTYQGRLIEGASAANGSYDLTFALFNVSSGPGQVGSTLTNTPVGVTNGLFALTLDFGANFPGADRWLEIGVRTNGGGTFTTLAPRQKLSPTPHAIYSANAGSAATAATAATATTANNFSGALAGNVTGTQGATVVGNVGGQSAANVASGASAANAATSANTPNTIVKRDGSGNFAAGGITAGGMVTANGGVRLNDLNLWLRNDNNHGLGWYGLGKPFGGTSNLIDGPVLFGYAGGALGTETAGPEKIALLWNASGNVGIGSTSPGARLTVDGPAAVSGSSGVGLVSVGPVNGLHLAFDGDDIMAYNNNTPVLLDLGYFGGGVRLASGGGPVIVGGPANFMATATFSDNVGIGTNNPQSALHVVGTVTADSFVSTAAAAAPPGMALIPAGAFIMGNSTGDPRAYVPDANPIGVTVSAFYMDVNLVSYSQWQSVYSWAGPHGYVFGAGAGKGANHPVQTVYWYDCAKGCNARSEQAGKTPVYYTDAGLTTVYKTGDVTVDVNANWAANGYRLPTEAEWEKAARGGLSGQRFPWGNFINQNFANYLGDTATFSYDLGPNGYNPIGSIGGTTPATSPVGSFAANGYGLYDMAGNVFEWCWDWHGRLYAGGNDPHGPATMDSTFGRVVRGGSGVEPAFALGCAYRGSHWPSIPDQNIGFRCVRGL